MSTSPSISEMMDDTNQLLASTPMRFIPVAAEQPQLTHYINDSARHEWLAAMREIESEGSRSPAQPSEPLVRIADTWVTQETAAEFYAERAA